MPNASLYIHIPFCNSKCDYCDFYSIQVGAFRHLRGLQEKGLEGTLGSYIPNKVEKKLSGGDPSSKLLPETRSFFIEFLDALILDINGQVERFNVRSIPTVYVGGGTPSVLGGDILKLLGAIRALPNFAPEEFTVEANPESLTEEFLAVCKENGVTRISLGVQTFYEPSRQAVNRAGDCAVVEKALMLAKDFFPQDLSADLITGFPYHTKKIVTDDIKRLLDFDPVHVSVYSLTLEPDTVLKNLPGNDESSDMWLAARDLLVKEGFKHYEVSNFARAGCECKHNIRYWRMQSWLGAGPSASGTIIDEETCTAQRYSYDSKVEEFVHELHELTRIIINREELIKEIILMGYRYCDGPDPKWGVEKLIPNTLEKWKGKDKMLFLNSFLIDAFNELGNFNHEPHEPHELTTSN